MSNNMSSPPSNNNKQSSPPNNNSDLESLNSSDNEDNNTKAHSFRERRLTYTRHHVLSDNAAAAVASLLADGNSDDFSDDDEMKKPAAQQKQDNIEEEGGAVAPSNEKRKQTNDNSDHVDEQPKKKKPRISIKLSANNSTTNSTSNTNTNKKQLNHLPSRILHAGEIVRRLSEEEDSKDGDTRTGMYSHPSHSNQHNHHNSTTEQKNKWRRRFSFTKSTPDSQLPFPRYQVGTFSCAGLEPLYDSDYGSSSSDDEESWDGERDKREENGGWDKEKQSDDNGEDEDCGSSGDGGIYANNSSPSNNNNNTGKGKVLPTSNPNNKSPISPIKKQKHTTSKINQDRGGITYPYANSTTMALFSVYDGHGEGGELVSQFALGEVGRLLEERLVSLVTKRGSGRLKGIAEDAEEEESDQDNNNNIQDNTINQQQQQEQEEEYITTSIKQVFNQVDNDLLNEEDIEPMYSGTTACIVLLKESKLYIGNCGDSRAVLTKKKKNRCHTEEGKDVGEDRELITVDLSTDQNPDTPGEKERIESLGGFVSPPPEPGLSSRVWLDSSHTQIGLAMARSIGDHAVKGVGVISEPEVTTHVIDEDLDEFVIIATDGVWEFLSSEDAVDIVQKHLYNANDGEETKKEGGYGASVACEALIKAASDKWHEHEGNYRDDITAIVVRLKDLLS